MSLKLPYNNDQVIQNTNSLIKEEDKKNQKIDKNYLMTGGVNLVLQSANGTYYKLVVDNSGNLSTTAITNI